MVHGWIPIIFCLLLIPCSGSEIKEARGCAKNSNITQCQLKNALFDGYDKALRPVKKWNTTTTVYIDITVYAILAMDEKEQLLTIYFLDNRFWDDEYLQWDPEEYDNMEELSLPSDYVWMPDIHIEEFVHSEKRSKSDYIYIDYYGTVYHQKTTTMSAMCIFNLYYFPFDKQNCTLSFRSQIHTLADVNVSTFQHDKDQKKAIQKYNNKGEFELLNITRSYMDLHTQGVHVGMLQFHIIFRRYPMFYIVNLIMPSTFLIIMDVIGFYLPPESGERISFKITVLLGYSVFLVIVSETLPALAHETALIEVYFVVCLALLVISLAESIFIVRLVNKKNIQSKVPKWIKKLILENKFILFCIKDKSRYFQPDINSSHASTGMDSTSTDKLSRLTENEGNFNTLPATASMKEHHEILQSILNEITAIRQDLAKEQDQDTSKEWLVVGYVLDKFLFCLYLVILLIYIVSLTICWLNY